MHPSDNDIQNIEPDDEVNPQDSFEAYDSSENASEEASPSPKDNGETTQASESKFKEGQKLTMINVRFPGNAKSHPFLLGKKKLNYNQKVLAMSDRGMTIGYVNSFPYEVDYHPSMQPIKSVSQIPSEADIKAKNDLEHKEKQTEDICKNLIEKHKLDMIITHVEIIQFGKKAVFYFNSPSRVDFRGLVKDLVSELKMRIELRQISIRDRAAGLGAISSCGQKTCCSYFLKDYGNVSIKMAKNQNITLLPGKINGVCGQIKCCMRFENEHYTEKREALPKENTIIRTKSKDIGKVIRLNLLESTFDLITNNGVKRRYYKTEFSSEDSYLENPDFPTRFEHIIDETSQVIGLVKKACAPDCECEEACYHNHPTTYPEQFPENYEIAPPSPDEDNPAPNPTPEQRPNQSRPHHYKNRSNHQSGGQHFKNKHNKGN
ncbi:MAG: hypothetical protein A2381_06345 [Bdellovibrionales bacterium RIFOXYB1_FULL_37_110]|nr:MAG: hypothetical protein A2181_08365 [Bdellovibrionales bacterium RIFOXYA1_FULL_38_20]OFZ50161.1 MAG: hypothetical protein A2417_19195 [Bdellovibrionales bacterium RIFOXYC1_FULL_37_79]OFZ57598.1 MAG: hypothetical protein A2381_06345 [Bdellovibrionales bacterium RIFOXYB1_FULL_37_110]OFZ61365.1 MAG: hypothetical protein A2577_00710 [Bdellovibrionales bacterium RIFOXYD1_FULL_36_51]